MDVQITPEPRPEEREAIIRALELELEAGAEPTPWQKLGREAFTADGGTADLHCSHGSI